MAGAWGLQNFAEQPQAEPRGERNEFPQNNPYGRRDEPTEFFRGTTPCNGHGGRVKKNSRDNSKQSSAGARTCAAQDFSRNYPMQSGRNRYSSSVPTRVREVGRTVVPHAPRAPSPLWGGLGRGWSKKA